MEEIVLIPAYKPDEKLTDLVKELSSEGFGILIVNDGSPEEYNKIFEEASSLAEILTLPKNCGKGSALKAGMSEIRKAHPECKHFITADADGQHLVKDIIRVRNELRAGSGLVLTVRHLRGNIPKRSKFGNRMSRVIYTILTGHYFNDNQSGLRGFCAESIDWMARVSGDKYDYEMNVLYHADKQALPITTIGIEAVYIDGNRSSHFNPTTDTVRIYKKLFSSAWVTFASFILAELMIIALSLTIGFNYVLHTVPAVGIHIAFFSVLLNKFLAFRKFRYADGLRTIIHTICRFCIYGLLCQLIHLMLPWEWIPLWAVFDLVVIAVIPLEYLVHKLMHKFKHREIVKE